MIERHRFVPDTIWVDGDDGWMVPLHRSEDPDRWMALCRSDSPIVTQVDDGDPVDGKGARVSSSSTMPSIMRAMIERLDLARGCRILEIGTGTGLNAAWIAEIVGAGNVTTIEVDEGVAKHARKALRDAGCPGGVRTNGPVTTTRPRPTGHRRVRRSPGVTVRGSPWDCCFRGSPVDAP